MDLHIDVRWLLKRQEEILPQDPAIADYSALVAAVARHRVAPPRLGAEPDASWRAAALLHSIALLRPLAYLNEQFGCGIVVAYMHASREGLDAPYGALIDLVRDIQAHKVDTFAAADRIRSWRI